MAQWPCLIDSGFQKALENVDVAQRHQSHDSIYTVLLPFFISSTRDSLSSQWNVSHENPMEGDRVMETFLTLQWEFGSQHSGWWLAENPKSFSFLTSQGGSWGCQSQCLYTLPALDWMAHSPFLTGLQRNRPRSPDNAVITTTHPFCRLAKFRSTGHREQKKVTLLDHLKLGDTVASFFLLLSGQNWKQTKVKLRPPWKEADVSFPSCDLEKHKLVGRIWET